MTPQQINQLETVTRIQCLMQCVLYQIDELSSDTIYKREHKQRFENFYTYISKLVETLTDGFKSEDTQVQKEMESYVKICNEIEEILTKVTIEG